MASSNAGQQPICTLTQLIKLLGLKDETAMNKIKTIVVDTDSESVRNAALASETPIDVIRKQPNVMCDDQYLTKNESGDYEIDSKRIIDRYKDYYVSMCCPMVDESNRDEVLELQEIAEMTGDVEDYFKSIAPMAQSCDIIISEKEPLTMPSKPSPSVMVPRFKSSVSCWMMFDYVYLEEDAMVEGQEGAYVDSHIYPIGCVDDIQSAQKVIAKRKCCYTAICQVVNGRVKSKSYSIYYTGYDGTIQLIATE